MSNIKKNLLKGVFWSAVEKYSSTVVSLVISAILARLIEPADYGVVAIATVLIAFFSVFSNMGIGPAIIQRNDLTKANLDSIFTYTVLIGCILGTLFCGSSWLIADFYGDDRLSIICQLLSVNLLAASINIVPNALILKNQQFKLIAKRTISLQTIGGCLAIIAAFNGWGIYALLIAPIFSSVLVCSVNLYYYPRRLDWSFDIKPIQSIFSYSVYQFLFEFVNYFSRNLDKLVIGKYLNMDALGYYEKSYRLMLLPLHKVTSVINPVLQPVLADLQNDMVEMSDKYTKIITSLAFISFPIAIFLYFSAPNLVVIIYGERWIPAIASFQILTLSLPFQMILSSSGAIFQASNSTKEQFYNGLRNTFFTVSSLLIAVLFFETIEAIAWAWDISLFTNFFLSYLSMYHRVLKTPFKELWISMKVPFLSTIPLAFVLWLLSSLDLENHFISLILQILGAGASMWLMAVVFVNKTPIKILKEMFNK